MASPRFKKALLRHDRAHDHQEQGSEGEGPGHALHGFISRSPAAVKAGAYSPRKVGSSTSRSQSPVRLITMEVIMRTTPGEVEIHQAESR
jgi:hypothetical protein